MELDIISGEIVDSAVKLHTRVGPGLLESVYECLLAQELRRRGLRVERQKPIPLELDGIRFEESFRLDLLVEDAVIVEVKSVDRLAPAHWKQLLTYLRLLDLRLGLLINFGGVTLKEGLKRVVNRYVDSASPRLGAERPQSERAGQARTTPPGAACG